MTPNPRQGDKHVKSDVFVGKRSDYASKVTCLSGMVGLSVKSDVFVGKRSDYASKVMNNIPGIVGLGVKNDVFVVKSLD